MHLPQGRRRHWMPTCQAHRNEWRKQRQGQSAISHVGVNQLREGNLTILERVNSRRRHEPRVGQSLLSMIRRSLSSLDAVAVQLLIYLSDAHAHEKRTMRHRRGGGCSTTGGAARTTGASWPWRPTIKAIRKTLACRSAGGNVKAGTFSLQIHYLGCCKKYLAQRAEVWCGYRT